MVGGVVWVAKILITRFGHSEIVLEPGRIRNIERLGPLWQWSTHSLATMNRLYIVRPEIVLKTRGEPLMMFEAYFSDRPPLKLASLYPTEALKPVARELLAAIPNFGGSKKVVFAPPRRR